MNLFYTGFDEGGAKRLAVSHSLDDAPSPDCFSRHCHDGYELLYVTQGEGRYVIEGEEYALRANTLLLIPPHAFHYVKINFNKPYERYVVNFGEEIFSPEVRDCLDGMFSGAEQYGRFYQGENTPALVGQSLFSLRETAGMSESAARCYAVSLLSTILLRLSVNAPVTSGRAPVSLGSRVVRYLNAHLTENISLDTLAKNFFVSKFHLCRAFKEYNGVSVLQYITEKRVMYARRLVERGETAVAAAAKAGFGDYSSFYRAHRRICGSAPRNNKKIPASQQSFGRKGGTALD